MSVTAAKGFRAAGVVAGLKASGKPDVAVVVNDGPLFVGAGVFTSNRVVAAPVVWSRQVVADGRVDVVVLNSGGANACTGPDGFADTHRTAEHVAALFPGLSAGDVAVCSTGLIGERLPMDTLLTGIDRAVAAVSADGGSSAAEAIMTTDTVPKTVTVTGDGYIVGGMAKGAGMLAPALATMLCVITTDASVTAEQAQAALAAACAQTFDRLDSDGCMSTNDTVLLLASGASGVQADAAGFTAAVTDACASLAEQLLADAEGASHDIAIHVRGAHSTEAALAVGRAVARSNLFKAAIYGNDPNWGRILSALGTVPESIAPFDANAVDVAINGVHVCRAGGAHADRSLVRLADQRRVDIDINLHAGTETVTVLTNDLTHDYVTENSAYST